MSSATTGSHIGLNQVLKTQDASLWLRRSTRAKGWSMAKQPLPVVKALANEVAGAVQSEVFGRRDDPSENATFAELEKHAATVGLSLSKTCRGFLLTRGRSSVHFSDIHTTKEILATLNSHASGCDKKRY